MKVVKAFSPAHITGIFAVERGLNPLTTGSRGVGVTLTKGVRTELKAEPSTRWKVSVKGFGAEIEGEVSRRVVELLASKAPKPYHVEIVHRFEVPVGAGYGASGAGALGVALTLNEALNLGLTPLEAANTAHVAEVECMTGLGT
ncbi:MAG: GHMP family kinase ATP-binding protein, partial [Candidatus Hecatellaceae archaeon]